MLSIFRHLMKSEHGATAIEYTLISSLIAVAAIVAMRSVGGKIQNVLSNVSHAMGWPGRRAGSPKGRWCGLTERVGGGGSVRPAGTQNFGKSAPAGRFPEGGLQESESVDLRDCERLFLSSALALARVPNCFGTAFAQLGHCAAPLEYFCVPTATS